jgi:tungstate transport system substrate-binding protein
MKMVGNLVKWSLRLAILAGVAGAPACVSALAADTSIVLASTTSVENSGLLSDILPKFTAKTGISVRVIAQGTGQALDTARRGDADLVLVHDPEAEQKFMDEGHGATRRQIAWNDFIVVGPTADPAHVGGGHDSVAGFKAIAAVKAPFVSRGDRSGTNAAELRLWSAAGIAPGKDGQGTWYRDIGGGMGQALNAASAMNAYTLSDRGTWLSFGNKGSLTIVIEGDPRLVNRYEVIELNPEKHGNAKLQAAGTLAAWLVSPEGQQAIGSYEMGGQQLFYPSATSPK